MTGIMWIVLSTMGFFYIIYNLRRQIRASNSFVQVLLLFWLSLVAIAFFTVCLLNGVSLLQQ